MDTIAARSWTFAQYSARLKQRIDVELGTGLDHHFPTISPAGLEALRLVLADGKRLRGCFSCLVAQALGGRAEDALPAAVAIEIVQAASLVHDDLVDADVVRRGRPATWTWLTPRRAVLAADVMFATALERMAETGAAEAATLARSISQMARGAMEELDSGVEAYTQVSEWKTGSLFAAAMRLGAIAAGAPDSMAATAERYGARTGYAYQLADDLVDITEASTGRSLARRDRLRLEPALRYFSARSDTPWPDVPADGESPSGWFEDAAPRLLAAMRVEIEGALRQAEREADAFPDNPYSRLLRDAPRDCVRIMTEATGWACAPSRSPSHTR
jgi:hypothetical protein